MGKANIFAKCGAVIVTVAMFILGVTLPQTPWIDENRAIYVSMVAIVALFVGAILWFFGNKLTKYEGVTTSRLRNIVPALEQMDSMLREQALRESKKTFNINKYLQVNERINVEILGVKRVTSTTPDTARKELAKIQASFAKDYKEKGEDLLLEIAGLMSGAFDSSGFGLKAYRNKVQYKKLIRELTSHRNYVIDEDLNKLIREHVSASETFNNMLLATERAQNVKADYRERLIKIRVNIGKRVDELEGKKNELKYCQSENVIKYGKYNDVQRYFCKDCGSKFKDDDTLFHMKTPANQVSSALNMYYEGMSIKAIRRNLQPC